MSLFEQIQKERIQAMKDKHDMKKNLLGVLLAEAAKENKTPDDAKVIATITKFLKANEQSQAFADGRQEAVLKSEWAILNEYLPKQLTEQELEDIIKKLYKDSIDNPINGEPYHTVGLGDVMKHLKENYAGKYDGKLASVVAKRIVG